MSYLETPTRYITVANKKIAYRELGEGNSEIPLVMLVHLAATMDDWDPKTIDLIAEHQHVIVVDLPGVGSSEGSVATTIPGMANQAAAIIKALGHQKINLLGLSMGGMIAQEVVRAYPTLVNRLILVGTGPRGGAGIDAVTGTTFRHMARASREKISPKRYIFYTHDEQGGIEAQRVLDRMASRTEANQGTPMKVPGFLRQLLAIRRWGTQPQDDMAYITQPTLIVNGETDMMVPSVNSYDMHRKVANSELIMYKRSGHGALFQYPEKFTEDLLKFLES